ACCSCDGSRPRLTRATACPRCNNSVVSSFVKVQTPPIVSVVSRIRMLPLFRRSQITHKSHRRSRNREFTQPHMSLTFRCARTFLSPLHSEQGSREESCWVHSRERLLPSRAYLVLQHDRAKLNGALDQPGRLEANRAQPRCPREETPTSVEPDWVNKVAWSFSRNSVTVHVITGESTSSR